MTLETSADPRAPAPVGRSRRPWIIGALALIVLGSAAVVAVLLLRDDDLYPEEWASEVQPFVEIVEEERDLEFEHPVYVEFLPPAEFEKQVTADEDDLSDEEREELEQSTGMLRALGLVEGELDLFDALNQVTGAGTLAYYSYKDKRIRIRGEKLTPTIKVTLVHELTHALQDQHFDLGKRIDELEDADDDSARSAFDALVEGDAERIEAAYTDDLSETERKALDQERKKESKDYTDDIADLPPILSTLMGAPYALGEAMLQLAALDDGNAAVDELFERPPTTEEHLIDPWTLLVDEAEAAEVDPPELDEGVEEHDSGPFGALGWLLVLAERIPLMQALDATDGWGGDAYVSFEYAGKTCVQIAYEGDSRTDVKQMYAALERWVAALPGSPARVERAAGGLLFTSCDPGAAAEVGRDMSRDALQLALGRTYGSVNLINDGVPDELARCLANSLVHEFTQAQLLDTDYQRTAEFRQRVTTLVSACR